ncbi:phosphate-selective porin OprO/OprP [Pontibacter ummariensis]|uniref:Phosphate-selective porin OprO and OprP n=1 Tax=Pontibacter ummariensis TaxID=1610492 RepID=A0A239GIY3_9BACT|nr:phosphate-selective porin OprO/OprP [Pontibacter ummariensis]SNS69127.1 phosphate-selective porin OprO and OprP [Pontibacter ummariensis]
MLLLTGAFSSGYAQGVPLEAYWDEGLKFRSEDGLHVLGVGGRLHYDIAFLNQEEVLDSLFEEITDKAEVRRARISFEGVYNGVFAYEFEVDLQETLEYADMYIAFLRVPYLDLLMLGHLREPFGLEENTSSNEIPFMERSLTSAFGPSRNLGIMLQKHFWQNRVGVYTGVFRLVDDLGADLEGEGNHAFTSRVAFGYVLDTTANRVLHLGLAGSTRQPKGGLYEVEIENETNTSIRYIRTGKLEEVDRVKLIGGEVGYTQEALTLQAEYVSAFVKFEEEAGLAKRHGRYESYYIMASYFLSGGLRKYDTDSNELSDIVLTQKRQPFRVNGAWEVGVRYSYINLIDSVQPFRQMQDLTLGVNWYLSSSARLMMNYVFTKLQQEYNAQSLQFRIQVVF